MQNTVQNTMPKFDITKYQYSEEEIIKHIYDPDVSLRKILFYQKNLTAEFCKKYLIYNEKYSSGVEDTYISVEHVLYYQPQLKEEDFDDLFESDSESST